MKENILDVLIYVFENFMIDQEALFEPESKEVSHQLTQAGFSDKNILQAITWLMILKEKTIKLSSDEPFSSVRVYSADEYKKLTDASRYTIYCLERDQAITPSVRELIIDRLMALNNDQINTEELKWIMLFVLCFQRQIPVRVHHLENAILLENTDEVLH